MRLIHLSTLILSVFINGCATMSETEINAAYTSEEPDAALIDPIWNNAKVYRFQNGSAGTWYQEIEKKHNPKRKVRETGKIRFLWNEKALYVGISMEDSDLTDEATENQTHIFLQADTVELFLKSAAHKDYWEIYGSAGGRKTCYHFPSRGRLGLASNNRYQGVFSVKSICDGSLNRWQDRDRNWKLLFKIPVEELTRHGAEWKAGSEWKILLIRHNFSLDLPCREVSFFPAFSAENPHFYEKWGRLNLEQKKADKP